MCVCTIYINQQRYNLSWTVLLSQCTQALYRRPAGPRPLPKGLQSKTSRHPRPPNSALCGRKIFNSTRNSSSLPTPAVSYQLASHKIQWRHCSPDAHGSIAIGPHLQVVCKLAAIYSSSPGTGGGIGLFGMRVGLCGRVNHLRKYLRATSRSLKEKARNSTVMLPGTFSHVFKYALINVSVCRCCVDPSKKAVITCK